MPKEREVRSMEDREFHDERPRTINMLLDINNYFGESEKRLGPTLTFLCIAAAPALIYIYFLFDVVPLWYLIPPYIYLVFRAGLVVLGEEKKRLTTFKKALFDVYASAYALMNIKPLHEDGVLEYNNHLIAMGVLLENGTDMDVIVKAGMVDEILNKLAVTDYLDIYTQNVPEIDALRERYEGVNQIHNADVAKDYVKTIDSYIKKATYESLVTRTLIVIKGPMYKVEIMEDAIDDVLGSQYANIFKVFRRATKADLERAIMRDVGTYINFEEMLMNRFAKGNFLGSKVLGYDVEDKLEKSHLRSTKVNDVNTRGFMVSSEESDEAQEKIASSATSSLGENPEPSSSSSTTATAATSSVRKPASTTATSSARKTKATSATSSAKGTKKKGQPKPAFQRQPMKKKGGK